MTARAPRDLQGGRVLYLSKEQPLSMPITIRARVLYPLVGTEQPLSAPLTVRARVLYPSESVGQMEPFSAPLHLICDNLKGDGCHDTRIVKPLNSHASHGGNYISIIVTVNLNWVNQMFVIPSPK